MFELLKTFVVVYETRNFSVAAKQMFKTQPTISVQIQKLETELGFKLFERKGKQLILPTKQAEFLYPKVVDSLNSLASVFAQAKNAKISRRTAYWLAPIQLVFTYSQRSWAS